MKVELDPFDIQFIANLCADRKEGDKDKPLVNLLGSVPKELERIQSEINFVLNLKYNKPHGTAQRGDSSSTQQNQGRC